MATKKKQPDQYVVVARRQGQCMYLGKDGAWWDELKDARRFTEEEARRKSQRDEIATGYERVKS